MPEQVVAKDAPAALGAYSHAVKHAGVVYVSGQLGIDVSTGELAEGSEAQARFAMRNLSSILRASGSSLGRVMQCTVLLADISDFALVDGVYKAAFTECEDFKFFPARACF